VLLGGGLGAFGQLGARQKNALQEKEVPHLSRRQRTKCKYNADIFLYGFNLLYSIQHFFIKNFTFELFLVKCGNKTGLLKITKMATTEEEKTHHLTIEFPQLL
jgi:hypothetical protein